jgi:transposase InsO family protein
VILNAYSRSVRGWQLEEFLSWQTLNPPALRMSPQEGAPAVVHLDQGRQYAVRDHVDLLSDTGVVISLSDSGALTQNTLVERFIRTLKDEHLPYSEYGSLADMLQQLK